MILNDNSQVTAGWHRIWDLPGVVLCLAIPNLRIRKSPFPSIFTFGSMNALQSVQEVDEFIHNCFRDRHCPSVDDGSFKKAIGQHHEALDSFNGFLAAYTFLLVKTRSQGELKRACLETMDALERNGYLFSSHTVISVTTCHQKIIHCSFY